MVVLPRFTKKFLNREIALCGLAIFLCEELKHQRTESPIRPFIVFIVECLQVGYYFINRK